MKDRAKREAKVWAYFERTAAGDGKVDWRGLQKVLTYALKHDLVKTHKTSRCVGCCVNCFLTTCCAVICAALGLHDPGDLHLTSNNIVSMDYDLYEVGDSHTFTREICTGMITLMGGVGKIDLEHFKFLWADILHWNNVFKRFDRKDNDELSEDELKQALYAVGCQFGPDNNFADLISCYGSRKSSAPFDRFVMCIITCRLKKGMTPNYLC